MKPALLLFAGAAAVSAFVTDVDTHPFPVQRSDPGITLNTWSGEAQGKKYTGHVAVVSDPRFFSVEIAPGGSPHTAKTSVTADYRGCEFATNGGFFDMKTGAPAMNVLINSTLIASFGGATANFAVTDSEYITGYVTQADLQGKAYPWRQLIQGAGWLVRNSQPYVNQSLARGEVSAAFVNEMAPRTAIGYNATGALFLVVVDGEEDIKAGADLYMMQEIMYNLGVVSAVNLDGGGSSDAVYKGKIYSHPTCDDTKVECERDVSTITCIRY